MINAAIYIFTFGVLIAAVIAARGVKLKTRDICLIGMTAALTYILDLIRVPLPTGGSVRLLSVAPIMLLSLVYSYKTALASGLVTALLLTALSPAWAPVHPMQFFVEHLVCTVGLGFAGIFGQKGKNKLLGLSLAGIINLLGHIFAGALFFGAYAPEGMGVWKYTIIYNMGSQGTEILLSIVCLMAAPTAALAKSLRKGENP